VEDSIQWDGGTRTAAKRIQSETVQRRTVGSWTFCMTAEQRERRETREQTARDWMKWRIERKAVQSAIPWVFVKWFIVPTGTSELTRADEKQRFCSSLARLWARSPSHVYRIDRDTSLSLSLYSVSLCAGSQCLSVRNSIALWR